MADTSTTAPRPTETRFDERSVERPPLVLNRRTMGWIAAYVSSIVESRTPLWWWAAMAVTTPLALLLFSCIIYLVSTGVGVWGKNLPVGWAWDITNFVFWIGIGHAGTLISAILFLTRQKWRTSINRAAEAMTLFAVMCAAHLPGLPRRPRVDGLVPGAGAELPMASGQNFRVAAALGRLRGRHVLHGLGALLVYGPDSRSRHVARPGEDQDHASLPTAFLPWAGAAATASGATTRWPTSSSPVSRRRWCSRCTRSCPSTSPRPCSRLAHDDFPAVLRRRRHLRRLRDGAHLMIPGLRALQPLHDLVTMSTWTRWQDHLCHGIDRRLRLPDGALHRVVQRQPL